MTIAPLRDGGVRFTAAAAIACLLAGSLVACSEDPKHEPTAASSSPFLAPNGLLYPPELWGALEVSSTAVVVRRGVLLALGESAPPVEPPLEDLFNRMADERDPVTAAYLMDRTDLVTPSTAPWDSEDIKQWWTVAAASPDPAHQMLMVRDLARTADMELERSPRHDRALTRAVDSGHPLESFAAQVLNGADVVSGADAGSVLDTPEQAAVLLGLFTDEAPDAELPEGLLELATEAAERDDVSRLMVVEALVARGKTDRAESVAGSMNPERLLPDGEVLEEPVFQGTVGSTYRMLRWAKGPERVDLSAKERSELVSTVTSLLKVDAAHGVAGLSSLSLLGEEVSDDAGDAALKTILEGEGLDSPTDTRGALAWASVAEYADTLGRPIQFPGIRRQSLERWLKRDIATTAPSLARFLLALHATNPDSRQDKALDQTVDQMLTRLTALREGDLDSLETYTVAGAALAFSRWTGDELFPSAAVKKLLEGRKGDCRGGFEQFFRDQEGASTSCNVDSSLWVEELLAEGETP